MRVVVRALNVLSLLARSPHGLTLSEIGEELDLPVASTHRLVSVLVAEHFISRSPTNKRYFPGPAAYEFGQSSNNPRESALVSPHDALKDAGRASGETTFLSEFSENRVLCLALHESKHPLRLFVRVGQTMPLHAAASARVLLAWRDLDEVRRILGDGPFPAFTPDTPNTLLAVLERLRLIRSTGYDICESELDEDVWAVAAPIRSSVGIVLASVTIAAPRSRVEAVSEREHLTSIALAAAAEMSADLGWSEAE